MSKEEKSKSSFNKGRKKIPNMSDNSVKDKKIIPPKKRIKLLQTPTRIIKIFMVLLYAVIIFMLSSPFITATFYITSDLEATTDPSKAYSVYSTQEQIDAAEKELSGAFDSLEKKTDTESTEPKIAVSTADMDWTYHVANGVDYQDLVLLVEKAVHTDKSIYTEESVEKLNKATLKAQKALCSTVTVSRSIIQLMFSGDVSGTDLDGIGEIIVNVVLVYGIALLPIIGVFVTIFDKRRHIKNICGIVVSLLCLMDIFATVFPNVDSGAVMTIVGYILLFVLSIGGIYAKQQEDYIVSHPEKEAEFTEKHPQFVKALINYKRVTMKNTIDEEKKEEQERAAKKAVRKGK